MPDATAVTPAVVVPEDRLTLGATDARCAVTWSLGCTNGGGCLCPCMAEE